VPQVSMADRASQLVCAWIDAYYTKRDEEMISLAHPDIEVRPRVGHGSRQYLGLDGVRSWLEFTRPARSVIESYSTVVLDDGRVLAEATLGGMDVTALFEVRDEKIARVTMYISDRDLLEQLGKIHSPPRARAMHRIAGVSADAPL
jgi:hypothetical protein